MVNSPENSLLQLQDTFRAFVNAVIPRSPELAYYYGMIQYYGALDSQIEDYLIITLDSFDTPLAAPSAEILKSADIKNPSDQALTLVGLWEQSPSVINSLVSFTMMGYYSEWSGYGSTRLEEPNDRQLEFYPLSWSQIGYPGPSLGYHALRVYNFT